MTSSWIFYLIAFLMLIASFGVVLVRNPVHSVLLMILTFFLGSGIFIMLGAEFIAMILIIVYVGAIAVLFLFVVMMLDVEAIAVRKHQVKHLAIGLALCALLVVQIYMLIATQNFTDDPMFMEERLKNTQAIGMILYTKHILPFQTSGAILLAAMLGAICLTLERSKTVKRQNINKQVWRQREEAVELKEVNKESGIKL